MKRGKHPKTDRRNDHPELGSPPEQVIGRHQGASEPRRSIADIGIMTIRDDEFEAVLSAFPNDLGFHQGKHREYSLRQADAGDSAHYKIAVLRQIEQGNGEAQSAAHDLIEDLSPKLLILVGIAGGIPSDDLTLGDVVISTRIHDFTIEARKSGKQATYAAAGGPITKALAAKISNLAARKKELGEWTTGLPERPAVSWKRKGDLYGPTAWQNELRSRLEERYGEKASAVG